MIGALIGDLAGSVYEYSQFFKIKPLNIGTLIPEGAFFSDDTILTIAVADAILNGHDYGEKLKEYGKEYQNYLPKNIPYFEKMFSPGFVKWINGDFIGESKGNGAMMRVSPVGWLFDSEEEVIRNARLATILSHNTTEAIECATKVALTIFYARQGMRKEEIFDKLNIKITKPKLDKFNYTCLDTIDLVYYSLYKGNNFEDCIKSAISFGGDTDTNACIVGSMAEAFYDVEQNLRDKALSLLPNKFVSIISQCENIIDKQK